jgi:ABC-type transport system substrate-binding protein
MFGLKPMRKRRLATALFPAAFVLALASSDRAIVRQDDPSKFGGLLRIQGYPRLDQPRLDPAQGDWVFVTQHIFDGLIRMDSSLKIAPDLAEYWQASDGGKTYTFFLRKGVRFHSNRELTSADVKFSLERLLRPETHSPYAAFFVSKVVGGQEFYEGRAPEVTGFQALSRYLFVIRWRNPSLAAPALLSMSFARILPKEQVLAQGRDFFYRPVGTGAYRFAYWMRDPKLEIVGVRLERNPAYFGPKPYLEAIEYSPHFTLDQFRQGEVDVVPFLWDGLARTGCRVLEGGPLNITYLMMSCTVPPFDRARIRRALALAIDKERLAQAIASSAYVRRPTGNFVPSALPGFFPVDTLPRPDPEQLRRVLEEEGFFSEKKSPRLVLYLESPRSENDVRFHRELERQLRAVGLTLDLAYYRNLEELANVRRPYFVKVEWQMDFPDPENIVSQLFAGPTSLNRFANGYVNPDLLALVKSAEVEPSLTRRQELFQEMQKLLTRDMPAVPLFSNEQRIAVQPWVRGAKVPVMGFFYLNAKEIWLERKE